MANPLEDQSDFLYLGPSIADYRRALECDVWFKGGLTNDQKENLSKLVPYPLVLNRWHGDLLHCATDDLFSKRARSRYGNRFKRLPARLGSRYTLANPAGVLGFHRLLDSILSTINKTHSILFFLKPGSDLYEESESNVKEVYSERHFRSVKRIEAQILPALTQYFSSEQVSKDEKAHAAWVTDGLFEYIPKDISRDYRRELVALVEASSKFDSYIDSRLKKFLVDLH